jgi:hypothetical protein
MYFMATTKPRITISLEEQDYAVLKRLYTLNGVPMSRTVSELVAMLTPVLGRMADNLEAVAKADEETRSRIAESLEKHFFSVNKIYGEAVKSLDCFSEELDSQVKGSARGGADGGMRALRGRVGGASGEAPDCVTRGSGTQRETGSGA